MHPEVGEGACSMTAHAVTKSQPQTTRTMSLMLHLYRRGDEGCTTRFFTKASNVCKGRCLGMRRDASVPLIQGLDKGCRTEFFTKASKFRGRARRHQVLGFRSCVWRPPRVCFAKSSARNAQFGRGLLVRSPKGAPSQKLGFQV